MSKYSSSAHRSPPPPRNRIPAGVRGIGCVLIGVVPVFSWVLADGLVKQFGLRMNLPPQWLGYPKIPPALFRVQGLIPVLNFIGGLQGLTAKFIFFLAIIVILGALLSIVYGYIFKMFGPSQYGPNDVPPPNVRTRKYRR